MRNNKGNILIVDDNINNLQVLANILASNKYNVEFALSGINALALIIENNYDLIMLDIMMPELDGFEVCKKIKEASSENIPIIFVTSKTDIESVTKGFEYGAVDYIQKPYNTSELLARVKNHINLKNAMDIIQKQKEELQDIIFARNTFFSIIAHDLKNPIYGISLLMKQLSNKYDNLEQDIIKRYINEVKESANEVYVMLEALLEWSRLQSGALKPSPEEFPVLKIIQDIISLEKSKAKLKNISLITDCSENKSVFSDYNMTKTILRNIISNALKYTHQNGTVKISTYTKDSNLVFSVADNGIGIEDKYKNKILKPSEKHIRKGTENESGSGLGLILCREFVECNKGKIWFESTFGKGTTFFISLPQKP